MLTQYDELRAARGRAASTASSFGAAAADTSGAALFGGEPSGYGPAFDAVSLRGGKWLLPASPSPFLIWDIYCL